jgi:hypothetical protein
MPIAHETRVAAVHTTAPAPPRPAPALRLTAGPGHFHTVRMRCLALLLGLSVSALSCFSAPAAQTSTTGPGGTATTSATTTTGGAGGASGNGGSGGTATTACLAGETMCANACILGTDCSHSVTLAPPADGHVYVNGEAFVELVTTMTNDILSAHVADALVAFQAAEPGHFWIEVPPGVVGEADVTLDVAGSGGGSAAVSVVTKRVLDYRVAPEGTTWTTKTMDAPRGDYPAMATTFDDDVLLAGGCPVPQVSACTNTADLFDNVVVDTTSTPPDNAMSTKRWTATATTILDGTTIVAGACDTLEGCPYDSTLIDVFDPTNNAFSPAMGKLSIPRGFLRSLRLADGRVLFASDETPPFDIYDPIVDQVAPVASGVFSTATPVTGSIARLRDGTVLVVPGGGGANSIFDPVMGSFTPTGDSLAQYPDALIALGNGHVLAIGGLTVQLQGGTPYLTTSDVITEFDPQTQKFTPWTATLATSREASSAVMGRDGMIYVLGGLSGTGPLAYSCASAQDIAAFTFLASVEVLDPSKATVSAGPALPQVNASLRSAVLFDGTIVTGGGTPCGSKAMSYASVYYLQAPADPGE